MPDILNFISGRTSGQNGPFEEVFNPATGTVTGRVLISGVEEVDAAVSAAAAAFPGWAATPPLRRARILNRFLAIADSRSAMLAEVISAEHGKLVPDAKGEVQRGLEVVEFATGAPSFLRGDFSEDVGTSVDSYAMRQPLGVVAGITPFNFPAMVPMWMFPVALACGNTFILKPSERDPSASLLIAAWLIEAGLPSGVFNVIQGGRDAVDALIAHPHVKAVSFVGSTLVARAIHAACSARGKRCQALGGAKNHMVVMPDADMDSTADALMGAAFGSAGERCMAISVVVPVGAGTAERLLDKLLPRMRAIAVGTGTMPGADMGPLVTAAHRDRVKAYIDAGLAEGATPPRRWS